MKEKHTSKDGLSMGEPPSLLEQCTRYTVDSNEDTKPNPTILSKEEIHYHLENLYSNHEFIKYLLDYSNDIIIITERSGRVIYINPATMRRNGFQLSDFLGKKWDSIPGTLTTHEKITLGKAHLNALWRKKTTESVPVELIDINGESHPTKLTFKPLVTNNKTEYILVIGIDNITEEAIKGRLESIEHRYKTIAENTSDLIGMTTFSSKPVYTYASPSNKAILGYSPEEMIGQEAMTFIHPEDRKKLSTKLAYYLGKELAGNIINKKNIEEKLFFRARKKDGEYRLFEVTANLVGNEILFVSRDITERAKMQKELDQAKMTMDYASEEVFWVDKEANIIYANKKASELLGYTNEEILTKSVYDINKNFTTKEWEDYWNTLKKNGSILMESSEWKKNGQEFPTEVCYNFIDLGEESFACAFVRDISERIISRKKEQHYSENMKHLSKSALRFLDCRDMEEFFDIVVQQTRPLVGGAFLAAMLYDPQKDAVRISSIDEGTTNLSNLIQLLGRDLIGLEVELSNQVKQEILCGKLMSWQDKLYDLMGRKIPKSITKSIEKMLKIDKIYSIGFNHEGTILGSIAIVMPKGEDIEDVAVLETLFREASITLYRLLAEQEIKRQNQELKKTDKLKSDFLNMTSHELRTPMTAMKGYLEMLNLESFGELNDEQKNALKIVLRNIDRLNMLVQDILDTSRLESGTMKFLAKNVDIEELTQSVVETMQSQAESKKITLHSNVQAHLPEMFVDPERITQVLVNIINNAIKFSPEESTIDISVNQKKDQLLFCVTDKGIGIPEDELDKIFGLFHQAESGSDRKYGGTGLGLTISKAIVEAHGGRLWAESPGEHKGSSFKFLLPIAKECNLEEGFKQVSIFK